MALIAAIPGELFSCNMDTVIRISIGTTVIQGHQGHHTYCELTKDGPKQQASQEKPYYTSAEHCLDPSVAF